MLLTLFIWRVNNSKPEEGNAREHAKPTTYVNYNSFRPRNPRTFRLEPEEIQEIPPVQYLSEAVEISESEVAQTREQDERPTRSIIEAYIRELWGDKADTMIQVVNCESNFNPEAVNWEDAKITGYPSWGLAQLNRPKFKGWDDYKINLNLAYELYQKRGFQPWSCAKKTY